ncbi:MAG: hypothetical protein R6U36_00260 [Candidatus Fermentibacteraceae bacterium]
MAPRSIKVDGAEYLRIPLRTRLILRGDSLTCALREGLQASGETLSGDDILFVSEKAVGASQGRYYLLDEGEVKPGRLARLLSRYVTRTPAGIGLGMPETMQAALDECGVPRILLAACAGGLGKLFGRRGDFYRVAGPCARSIDGPTEGTIPPFNRAVSLSPTDPGGVARRLAKRFGCAAAVVDVNDLGGNVLGLHPNDLDGELICRILADNPLGQGRAQTPAGIIRPVTEAADG